MDAPCNVTGPEYGLEGFEDLHERAGLRAQHCRWRSGFRNSVEHGTITINATLLVENIESLMEELVSSEEKFYSDLKKPNHLLLTSNIRGIWRAPTTFRFMKQAQLKEWIARHHVHLKCWNGNQTLSPTQTNSSRTGCWQCIHGPRTLATWMPFNAPQNGVLKPSVRKAMSISVSCQHSLADWWPQHTDPTRIHWTRWFRRRSAPGAVSKSVNVLRYACL
jgi:hypothetical protein